jgi:membrane-associated protease RseP (regulator of RpoE activity)
MPSTEFPSSEPPLRELPWISSDLNPTVRVSWKGPVAAAALLLLTLATCLAAGTQFAASYANNESASIEEYLRALKLFYQNPAGLLAGVPFALTLLTVLGTHEIGHFLACRHHRIRSTYPLFIPFPSLIGTFGAFILMRSPIRTRSALFDVGASGPLTGFVFAVPALVYGVLHAKFVPALADTAHSQFVFGVPLLLNAVAAVIHPGVDPATLLLHPVGRAAWVGLFATSLNLLPVGQLDGGHILRSLSPVAHRRISLFLPFALLALGYLRHWSGWYIWAVLLVGLRLLRVPQIYDFQPLDAKRRFGTVIAGLVFLLTFMPAPVLNL